METRPFLEVPVWSLRWARGGGRGFRLPLPTLTTSPLALSRFLRRAAAGACKNRSAAPAAAPCFVHWTRSPPLPWTQKRKSQRSKAGKNNSSWPVETFRASNGERVFSDRPLPAAPILSSNPTRRPIAEPPALRARPHGALNLKLLQTQNPRSMVLEWGFVFCVRIYWAGPWPVWPGRISSSSQGSSSSLMTESISPNLAHSSGVNRSRIRATALWTRSPAPQ